MLIFVHRSFASQIMWINGRSTDNSPRRVETHSIGGSRVAPYGPTDSIDNAEIKVQNHW